MTSGAPRPSRGGAPSGARQTAACSSSCGAGCRGSKGEAEDAVESLAFAAIEAEGPAPRISIAVPVPAPSLPADVGRVLLDPAPPAAQWLEVLAAIRRDIQELRAEHRAEILAESDDSTKPASVTPGSSAGRSKAKSPQATQAPAAPARKRKRKIPPKQDEWEFFDPDQCGFAALLAKLEEIEGDA